MNSVPIMTLVRPQIIYSMSSTRPLSPILNLPSRHGAVTVVRMVKIPSTNAKSMGIRPFKMPTDLLDA